MGLQNKLNVLKAGSQEKLPAEVLDTMKRALDHLAASGQKEQALTVGATIPEFRLQDGKGNFFSIRELAGQKPLVLNFYRGFW